MTELTVDRARAARDAILAALERGGPVELGAVERLDLAGFQLLAAAAAAARSRGAELRFELRGEALATVEALGLGRYLDAGGKA